MLALFCFLGLLSCDRENKTKQMEIHGPTMGTTYSVKLLDFNQASNQEEIEALISSSLEKFNQIFSTYLSDSEISRVNQAAANEWIPVSHAFCVLLETAQEVSEVSGGAFDVTIGPLVNLWGFGPSGKNAAPSEEDISKLIDETGYQFLILDCANKQIRKEKNIEIDLSAIAKGHATSLIKDELLAIGATDMMIEIGGELTLVGKNQNRQPWRIAIEKPVGIEREAAQLLSVSDVSIATSGDYRNYYEVDGQRISHTIDPSTGSPITHALASVTVISENGALADAWATALNVLGESKAYSLAQELNLAAYFIVRVGDGFEVKYTDAFSSYMVKQ